MTSLKGLTSVYKGLRVCRQEGPAFERSAVYKSDLLLTTAGWVHGRFFFSDFSYLLNTFTEAR